MADKQPEPKENEFPSTQNVVIPNSFVKLNFLKQIDSRIDSNDNSLFMLFNLFITNPSEQNCQNLFSCCYQKFAPTMTNSDDEEKVMKYFGIVVDACKRINNAKKMIPNFEFKICQYRMDLLMSDPDKIIAIEFKRIRKNAMNLLHQNQWTNLEAVRNCKYGSQANRSLDPKYFWKIKHNDQGEKLNIEENCNSVKDVERCALNQLTFYINSLKLKGDFKGKEVFGFLCVHYGENTFLQKKRNLIDFEWR